jgi:hypothetical protein
MFGLEAVERACRAVEEAPEDKDVAAAACRAMETAVAALRELPP